MSDSEEEVETQQQPVPDSDDSIAGSLSELPVHDEELGEVLTRIADETKTLATLQEKKNSLSRSENRLYAKIVTEKIIAKILFRRCLELLNRRNPSPSSND